MLFTSYEILKSSNCVFVCVCARAVSLVSGGVGGAIDSVIDLVDRFLSSSVWCAKCIWCAKCKLFYAPILELYAVLCVVCVCTFYK